MTLNELIALLGIPSALAALIWTAYGVHLNRQTTRAQLWLNLREKFQGFDEVHLKLRPGGDWAVPGAGPKDPNEWAPVEGYMGLFEFCERLLEEGLLEEGIFRETYEYRVRNIVANERICVEKLVKRPKGWKAFIRLCKRWDVKLPQATAHP